MKRAINERLLANIETDSETGCWNWIKHKDIDGYGKIRINWKTWSAHRLAYTEWKSTIPDGLLVRHSCDNPSCINPDHLELGTHKDNMKDKQVRKRIVGSKHPYSKLSDIDVLAIRESTLSQEKLGKLYGVTQAHIGRIKRRVNWTHV